MVNILKKLFLLTALVLTARDLSAAETYNLDFSAPETGTYQTVFGTPSVQSSVGPFQNALVFDAVAGYEQIQLSGPFNSDGLEIHYDVLTHGLRDSNYHFGISLDTPEVRNMGFHGGFNRFDFFIPGHGYFGPSFNDDQVYHIGMWIDFMTETWIVSLDGAQFAPFDFEASQIDSIRFNLGPAILGTLDKPGTYVAIDNLTIASIPEPPIWSLLLAALVPACFWYHRKRPVLNTMAPSPRV